MFTNNWRLRLTSQYYANLLWANIPISLSQTGNNMGTNCIWKHWRVSNGNKFINSKKKIKKPKIKHFFAIKSKTGIDSYKFR